jgi:hypothetical protein
MPISTSGNPRFGRSLRTESTQCQYALRQHAVALGWPQERIMVIDSDLGQSGRYRRSCEKQEETGGALPLATGRIDVTVKDPTVPEPSTLILLVTGLGALQLGKMLHQTSRQ